MRTPAMEIVGWTVAAAAALSPLTASAQSITLYSNDFESPNLTPMVQCGNSLDGRAINTMYGTATVTYAQSFTVETVILDDPSNLYSNPQGIGGDYAIGMLAASQPDLLALTFDAQGRDFMNVGFHLAALDVSGCGGPFGVAIPTMVVELFDTPNGLSNISSPGTLLDSVTLTGTAPPDQWTLNWQYVVGELDASQATTGTVTIRFDLQDTGYGVFDNLSIVVADTGGIVDRDTDQVADDQDNCPDHANTDQSNVDLDLAGDVCDPEPNNPDVCGDIDGNGSDDCTPPPPIDAGVSDAGPVDTGTIADAGFADTGAAMDAGPPDSGIAVDSGVVLDSGNPAPDAGSVPDSGATPDAGTEAPEDEGCSCGAARSVEDHRTPWIAVLSVFALVLWGRRRAVADS